MAIIYSSNPIVFGTSGNDTIYAQNGSSSSSDIFGGAGNDVYYIDAFALYSSYSVADDYVIEDENGGTDTVNVNLYKYSYNGGQYGGDSYNLGNNIENLNVTAGSDDEDSYEFSIGGNDLANVIVATADSDYAHFQAYGGGGNDKITTGKNRDTLDGGLGNDTMSGGEGGDFYYVDSTADMVIESSTAYGGYDRVYSSATFTLGSFVEQLELTGNGNTNATGNALSNSLFGNAYNNKIAGLDGNDYINGKSGADTLLGGNGDDVLYGESQNDSIDGGAGNDTIYGGDGNNTMQGGAGNDKFYFVTASDIVADTGGSEDTIYATEQLTGDLAVGIENLTLIGSIAVGRGNALNNFIAGNSNNNILYGLAGNDILNGYEDDDILEAGDGNDLLDGGTGNDIMNGGNGDDIYIVDSSGDITNEVSDKGGKDTVFTSVGFDMKYNAQNIENATMVGNGDIDVFGNSAANWIKGNSGMNIILGLEGKDTLDGGADNDTIAGGDDIDILDGGAGDDDMYGGDGDDTYYVDSSSDTVNEYSAEGIDTVNASVSFDLSILGGVEVEKLILTGTADIFGTGNGLNNTITGNSGSNTLNGGTGNDTLTGGAGNDIYYVDSSLDKVIENANQGSDSIYSSITFSIAALTQVENLSLIDVASALNATGNASANNINGNSYANRLDGGGGNDGLSGGGDNDTLLGGAGNDTLEGGSGNDSMTGGAGNDTYYIDSALDVITELSGGGTDKVYSASSIDLNAAGFTQIENAEINFFGSGNITGNNLANALNGSKYSNVLIGGGGNDTLSGGSGTDTLEGGIGNDTYYYDGTDTITELENQGIDTVITYLTFGLNEDLENLTLTGGDNITGYGNSKANILTGNDGNNTLYGYSGKDVLIGGLGDDNLNGGDDADNMTGGAGNDVYTVDNVGDKVTESANGGIDEIRSLITFNLATKATQVENVTLINGDNGINVVGNALNNFIIGAGGNNKLEGGVGNDTLMGMGGTDVLTGGAGSDTFILNSSGAETITDFLVGTDSLLLTIGGGLTFDGAANSLNAGQFRLGTAASDSDDYLIYDKVTGNLFYDADGSGGGSAQTLIADFTNGTVLSAANFFDYIT